MGDVKGHIDRNRCLLRRLFVCACLTADPVLFFQVQEDGKGSIDDGVKGLLEETS